MRRVTDTVMVEVLRKARRLRAAMRGRDLRIDASGCAQTPLPPDIGYAAASAYSLTARELIRMAQSARRARTAKAETASA